MKICIATDDCFCSWPAAIPSLLSGLALLAGSMRRNKYTRPPRRRWRRATAILTRPMFVSIVYMDRKSLFLTHKRPNRGIGRKSHQGKWNSSGGNLCHHKIDREPPSSRPCANRPRTLFEKLGPWLCGLVFDSLALRHRVRWFWIQGLQENGAGWYTYHRYMACHGKTRGCWSGSIDRGFKFHYPHTGRSLIPSDHTSCCESSGIT